MTATDENLWRSLRLGDRVKIVHFPCEFSNREYTLHDETRAAYRHLIETAELLTVSRVDQDGHPWVDFKMQADDGMTEHHSLMLNHDGVVLADNGRQNI